MKKILFLLIVLLLVGCTSGKIDGDALYKTIKGEIAMEFVNNSKAVLIDVRTFEEFNENHIEGAINIPVDEITEERLKEITEDKLDNIIVYCRSGNRSKNAAIKIIELGYTNVYDLGSIDNWK